MKCDKKDEMTKVFSTCPVCKKKNVELTYCTMFRSAICDDCCNTHQLVISLSKSNAFANFLDILPDEVVENIINAVEWDDPFLEFNLPDNAPETKDECYRLLMRLCWKRPFKMNQFQVIVFLLFRYILLDRKLIRRKRIRIRKFKNDWKNKWK